jgi:uncharacterized membrane protein
MSGLRRRLREIVAPTSAGVLGLAAGALLAEAAVLLPYWRSLEPEVFLAWYAANAELLFRFFAPLEIAGALLALGAAVLDGWPRRGQSSFQLASAVLAVAVLAAFPLYFAETNTSFAAGTIPAAALADELTRWARWHWARTVLEVAAFAAALLALRERRAR